MDGETMAFVNLGRKVRLEGTCPVFMAFLSTLKSAGAAGQENG